MSRGSWLTADERNQRAIYDRDVTRPMSDKAPHFLAHRAHTKPPDLISISCLNNAAEQQLETFDNLSMITELKSEIDDDMAACMDVANTTLPPSNLWSTSSLAGATRRLREFIPEYKKDDEYWQKRQKNNEAAKKSREKRRINDVIMCRRIMELAHENKRLRLELEAIKRRYGMKLQLQVPVRKQMPALEFHSALSSSSSNVVAVRPVNRVGCSSSSSVTSSDSDGQASLRDVMYRQISDKHIPERQISDSQIADRQITARLILDRQITERQTADRQIADRQITDRQIPDSQITDKQISGRQISNRQIMDRHISDRQINNRQITDRQISDRQIPDRQIPDKQIPDSQTIDQLLSDRSQQSDVTRVDYERSSQSNTTQTTYNSKSLAANANSYSSNPASVMLRLSQSVSEISDVNRAEGNMTNTDQHPSVFSTSAELRHRESAARVKQLMRTALVNMSKNRSALQLQKSLLAGQKRSLYESRKQECRVDASETLSGISDVSSASDDDSLTNNRQMVESSRSERFLREAPLNLSYKRQRHAASNVNLLYAQETHSYISSSMNPRPTIVAHRKTVADENDQRRQLQQSVVTESLKTGHNQDLLQESKVYSTTDPYKDSVDSYKPLPPIVCISPSSSAESAAFYSASQMKHLSVSSRPFHKDLPPIDTLAGILSSDTDVHRYSLQQYRAECDSNIGRYELEGMSKSEPQLTDVAQSYLLNKYRNEKSVVAGNRQVRGGVPLKVWHKRSSAPNGEMTLNDGSSISVHSKEELAGQLRSFATAEHCRYGALSRHNESLWKYPTIANVSYRIKDNELNANEMINRNSAEYPDVQKAFRLTNVALVELEHEQNNGDKPAKRDNSTVHHI